MNEVPNPPAGHARAAGEPRPPDRRRTHGSKASRLTRWRNWRLPVKLGLVMLVPVLAVLVLGFVVINTEVTNANGYARTNRIVELSGDLRDAMRALQAERQDVAGGASDLPAAKVDTDAALGTVNRAIDTDRAAGDLDLVAIDAWSAADRAMADMRAVRDLAGSRADRATDVGSYTVLIDALFAVDRVLATDLGDAQLARESMALYDLSAAREEVLYQQAVVLAGMARGTMSVQDVTSLHGSEARLASRISDFRAVAAPDDMREFTDSVTGPALAQQSALLGAAIDQSGGMSGQVMPGMMIEIPADTWNAANDAVSTGIGRVVDDVAGKLRDSATTLRQRATTTASTVSVVLVVIVLTAAALLVLVGRQLLGSIQVLRRTARDVAARKLPDAVERIRAGETVDPSVRPVPVHTTDEVGQLARAFDAVHGEALRLAVEQANLRANYSELFVNLSRRSQSLVQRQLRLIEQLERDEEDPEQLSNLFKLDHLATRMRRNNENLMVLSGTELGRGPGQAVPLADLLRAAVSEIEQYQRVAVQPPPDLQVIGYAASDLVRLIAELLDNATAFSAPDSQVTLASHRTRAKTVVVDIVDHGIGMSDDDLARINGQLAQPGGVEERVSRRMGMFVVCKLADRHGVRVRLHGGQDIPGLRVTVTLPTELIIGDIGDVLPVPRGIPPLDRGPGRPDPLAGALTVTIPALPSAESSGVSLFAPLAGPESGAPFGPDGADADGLPEFIPPAPPEVTPIFDDMLSAWFSETPAKHARPDADGEEPHPVPGGDATGETSVSWTFAADDGWRAVDAAATHEPVEFTSVGLPKRQPKAKLLPGSVRAGEPDEDPDGEPGEPLAVERGAHADRTRARLSGFQRGLAQGRHAAARTATGDATGDATAAGDPATPDGTGNAVRGPEWPTSDGESGARYPVPADPNNSATAHGAPTNGAVPSGAPNGRTVNGLPKRVPRASRLARQAATATAATAAPGTASETTEIAPETARETGPESVPEWVTETDAVPPVSPNGETMLWSTAADDGWQAVRTVDAEPAELTAAGLPKRQPKARLLPGSVAGEEKTRADGWDAGVIRDRMSSFQQGVRRGRHGTAVGTVATTAERVEHGFHWNDWENEQ